MTAKNPRPSQHIGRLAAEFGLNPKTIRYYEAIGLLPEPSRTASGYRVYGDADRTRLQFIAQAKALGLSLREIGEILAIRQDGEPPCRHVSGLLDRKLAAIDAEIRALTDLRQELLALRREAGDMTDCDGPVCSIIERPRVVPTDPALPVDLPPDWKV